MKKYTKQTLNILTAMKYKKEKDWFIKNINKLQDEFFIIEDLKINQELFFEIRNKIQERVDFLIENNFCNGIISFGEKLFPKYKENIPDKEKSICLFYKGNLDLINEKCVAVIGHLNPDNAIKEIEEQIIDELCNNNITVISGLALGCDSIAHKQTLKKLGKTIAILPSPLDSITPSQNKELAENIVENGGLLLTEYYDKLDFMRDKYEFINRFIERDRLQALFSIAVILSASYKQDDKDEEGKKCDSGSRHAMEKAKKYNIKRAVIYSEELLKKLKDKKELNLNKKLKEERNSSVIVIDENNIRASISKMLLDTPKQGELF